MTQLQITELDEIRRYIIDSLPRDGPVSCPLVFGGKEYFATSYMLIELQVDSCLPESKEYGSFNPRNFNSLLKTVPDGVQGNVHLPRLVYITAACEHCQHNCTSCDGKGYWVCDHCDLGADCENCNGTGHQYRDSCPKCRGSGAVLEPAGYDIDGWRFPKREFDIFMAIYKKAQIIKEDGKAFLIFEFTGGRGVISGKEHKDAV